MKPLATTLQERSPLFSSILLPLNPSFQSTRSRAIQLIIRYSFRCDVTCPDTRCVCSHSARAEQWFRDPPHQVVSLAHLLITPFSASKGLLPFVIPQDSRSGTFLTLSGFPLLTTARLAISKNPSPLFDWTDKESDEERAILPETYRLEGEERKETRGEDPVVDSVVPYFVQHP